jgi:hypothetical protein
MACRESRAVPFDPTEAAWAAAAAGAVRQSVGVDVDSKGRLLPRPLPFQSQNRPWTMGHVDAKVGLGGRGGGSGEGLARRPLAPVRASIVQKVMASEISTLERKLAHADRQVRLQEQLIDGFCRREVARCNRARLE